MKIVLTNYRHPFFLFIFYGFIAAAILAPLASNIYAPRSLDLINHLQLIVQAKEAIAEGQFPIREISHYLSGLRYPIFQFYSPTPYTIAGYLYRWFTPSNPYIAYKLMLWISLIAAGIFMQRLAQKFIKSETASILTSVIYLTAPYNLICIIHICAFTETIAFCMLPALMYYMLQCYENQKIKDFFLSTAAWYLLITTHLITFIYTSFIFGILLLLIVCKHPKDAVKILSVGLAYGAACLLAMWHLAPIIKLSGLFQINDTFKNFDSFIPPFLSLVSYNANYILTSDINLGSYIIPNVGWSILLGVSICIYNLLNKNLLISSRSHYWLSSLIITFIITFFLIWSPINIWKWMPKALMAAQYNWRLLNQVSLMGALITCWTICWLCKNNVIYIHVIFGTIIIFTTSASWLPTTTPQSQSLIEFINNPQVNFKTSDYLLKQTPLNKTLQTLESKEKKLEIDAIIPFCSFTKPNTVCHLFVPRDITLLEIPSHYYPQLLQVTLNGNNVAYKSILHNGYQIVGVTPVSGQINNITIQFRGLTWANVVSSLAWYSYFIIWLYLIICYFAKRELKK